MPWRQQPSSASHPLPRTIPDEPLPYLHLRPSHPPLPPCAPLHPHAAPPVPTCLPRPQVFLWSPVELLKLRAQLQTVAPGTPGYRNPAQLAVGVLRQDGVAGGLARGVGCGMLGAGCGDATAGACGGWMQARGWC